MTMRVLLGVVLCSFVAAAAQLALVFAPPGYAISNSDAAVPLPARLSEKTTLWAIRRAGGSIRPGDGRDLETAYSGSPDAVQLLEHEAARPASLAAGDFNEDGVADLICGYDIDGSGIVTLHLAALDSVYPQSREANAASNEPTTLVAPFLSSTGAYRISESADYIAAGDFNGDGYLDVITAARNGNRLRLLNGNGKGELAAERFIDLPGAVTALRGGEINRADGLSDLIVGVKGGDGPQVLIFEGPNGALNAIPEGIALNDEATSFALDQLEGDPCLDLAIAAGKKVVIVRGRDRKLSSADVRGGGAESAVTTQLRFKTPIVSIETGNFAATGRREIAVLDRNGVLRLLTTVTPSQSSGDLSDKPFEWKEVVKSTSIARSIGANAFAASQMIKARLSSAATEELLVVDRERRQVHVVALRQDRTTRLEVTASLQADAEPIALLTMRLNSDAMSDILLLKSGSTAPAVVLSPAAIFTVNSIADFNSNDANPGDGVCATQSNECTLRAAIEEANAFAGSDTIAFDLGPGTPSINVGISGQGALPTITEAVTIDGATGGSTRIELNGTDAGQTAAGLLVAAGGTTIRGLVINRFSGGGIILTGGGGNIIEGNFIGTDSSGAAGDQGQGEGISVRNSQNNRIGGTTAAARNVISFNVVGVRIDGIQAIGNSVVGNFIGSDVSGTLDLGNQLSGVDIVNSASLNTIGGTGAGSGNLISGNDSEGVLLSGPGNLVQGNLIGTTSGGNTRLGNTGDGIVISSVSMNTVGGTTAASRNIISGNGVAGVSVVVGMDNLVQGNFIGTNASGVAALDNTAGGVVVFGVGMAPGGATGNTIGGSTAGAGNVVSGNGGPGIFLVQNASLNLIQGNLIGTNAAGNAAIGNALTGISLESATNNTIGGTAAGTRNVISGNNGAGVAILFASSSNQILGNLIGTDLTQTAALGNNGIGVALSTDVLNNSIGGTVPGAGNVIANNLFGVFADGSSLTGNAILSNSIFSNLMLGIDLNADGVTPNDTGDPDTGPNNLQNFPVLTSAVSGGGITTIVGTLDSVANTTFRIEFFSNAACDSSGNGEGELFVGAANVATPTSGPALFNVSLPVAVAGGRVITATATDPDNDTSEFSPCITVSGPSVLADLSIGKVASPDPVAPGTNISYTITVLNSGPDAASAVLMSDMIPAGTSFQSVNTPPGWTCSPPASGAILSCSNPSLAAGQSAIFNVEVTVDPAASDGTIISNTAIVSANTSDPNSGNNTAVASTTVGAVTCTIFCPRDISVASSSNACGAVVKYSLPATSGPCGGGVFCSPPSSSFFPVGITTVLCTTPAQVTCSFRIEVIDTTPPLLRCPSNIMQSLGPNEQSTIVNYPTPLVTENCIQRSLVCTPPPGSVFSIGSTSVSCTATDAAGNSASCSFTVTVTDAQAPAISCPPNIVVQAPAGQCSPNVTYPAPVVSDNFPGAVVSCAPPSGSAFSIGTTTVACTATDSAGNQATCSFTVSVNAGPAQPRIVIQGGSAVEFGNPTPIPPRRKARRNPPCSNFMIENVGSSELMLTFDSILRTGADVDGQRITEPDDRSLFSLRLITADQSLINLDPGAVVTIQPCQSLTFCVTFNPTIPAPAGRTTGLAARDVLPETVTSRVQFIQAGGASVVVNLLGHVAPEVLFINPNNPRKNPRPTFSRSGDEFTVTYALLDPSLDTTRARYEFLNQSGAVLGQPIEVDLSQPIQQQNLVTGQSFSVEQRFTGASSRPDIAAVRLTIFDEQTEVTTTLQLSSSSASALTVEALSGSADTSLSLPVCRLAGTVPRRDSPRLHR